MHIQNNDQDNRDIGKAALEVAVKNEDVEIIQLILKHSIDVNIKCTKLGIEYWSRYGGGNDNIFIKKIVLSATVQNENCEHVKLFLANDNIDV